MTTKWSLKPPCIWKQTADRSVVAVPGSLLWNGSTSEHQREKKKSAPRCNLSSLWHLNGLFRTFYIRSEWEQIPKAHAHTHRHTHYTWYCTQYTLYYYSTFISWDIHWPKTEFCTIQNVSSRLQISYFFNCCHNQIYLSKQISLELLTMEMCVSTEAKTIYHVQESTRDVMTKKQTTKKNDQK